MHGFFFGDAPKKVGICALCCFQQQRLACEGEPLLADQCVEIGTRRSAVDPAADAGLKSGETSSAAESLLQKRGVPQRFA